MSSSDEYETEPNVNGKRAKGSSGSRKESKLYGILDSLVFTATKLVNKNHTVPNAVYNVIEPDREEFYKDKDKVLAFCSARLKVLEKPVDKGKLNDFLRDHGPNNPTYKLIKRVTGRYPDTGLCVVSDEELEATLVDQRYGVLALERELALRTEAARIYILKEIQRLFLQNMDDDILNNFNVYEQVDPYAEHEGFYPENIPHASATVVPPQPPQQPGSNPVAPDGTIEVEATELDAPTRALALTDDQSYNVDARGQDID